MTILGWGGGAGVGIKRQEKVHKQTLCKLEIEKREYREKRDGGEKEECNGEIILKRFLRNAQSLRMVGLPIVIRNLNLKQLSP